MFKVNNRNTRTKVLNKLIPYSSVPIVNFEQVNILSIYYQLQDYLKKNGLQYVKKCPCSEFSRFLFSGIWTKWLTLRKKRLYSEFL